MLETGFLTRYIPEFEGVADRIQYLVFYKFVIVTQTVFVKHTVFIDNNRIINTAAQCEVL